MGDEPFAVLLGDDVVYNDENPCLKQLIDVYNTYGGSVLGYLAARSYRKKRFLRMVLLQVKIPLLSVFSK